MARVNSVQDLTATQFRIYNEEDWAKNFPGAGRPPFQTGITFDDQFTSIYERWSLEPFEDGFRIQSIGTGFWACANKGEVDGTNEFDPETCKWYIERAGDGKFVVKVPNKDSVWTVKRRQPDYPKSLFLEGADGSAAQLFSFERLLQ